MNFQFLIFNLPTGQAGLQIIFNYQIYNNSLFVISNPPAGGEKSITYYRFLLTLRYRYGFVEMTTKN